MPVNEDLILTVNLGLDIAPSRLDTLGRKKTPVSYEECGFLDCSDELNDVLGGPGRNRTTDTRIFNLCHSNVGLALILIIGIPFYRDEKMPEDLTALRAVGDR